MGYRECINIIMENAELAEESVAKFIATCMNKTNYTGDHNYMPQALYDVLKEVVGDFSHIVATVVNDEGYFKWRSLDAYNKDYAAHEYDGVFGALIYAWAELNNINRPRVEPYVPEVDFITHNPGMGPTWNPFTEKLPYCINCYYRDITFNKIRSKVFPKDSYIGMLVDRNDYPQAIDAKKEPHYAAEYINLRGYTSRKLDKPGGRVIYPVKSNDSRDANPGLIYVPAKRARATILKDVRGSTPIDTFLPKHILEKYNLPTMEI